MSNFCIILCGLIIINALSIYPVYKHVKQIILDELKLEKNLVIRRLAIFIYFAICLLLYAPVELYFKIRKYLTGK